MRWIFDTTPDESKIDELAQAINVNSVLARILINRGITSYEEAKSFFRPSLDHLHDPFLMKDLGKAADRLYEALSSQQNILIYGDYDVDGTTSVAMMVKFLSGLSSQIRYYIPDRYAEGYGVSETGILWAAEQNIDLIITLDCGIRAVDRVRQANELGMEVIICDHHEPGDELPEALAILDPKQPGCTYPYRELSGCGVGFKLLQGLCKRYGIEPSHLYNLLEFTAVSIASDIVPITGENRVLAYYGLKQLNSAPSPGFKALLEVSGIQGEVDINSIVFGIGPRINAAGRMDHASQALAVLIAESEEEATALASEVNARNSDRRATDLNITEQALEMIASDEELVQAKSTVLFRKDWHKGVIGIVASRCIEKYHRPTVILTESNEKATGSVRSVPGFDVYQAICECGDLLEKFGGHKYAAGLTLPIDRVEEFRARFEEVVSARILEEQLIPAVRVDAILELNRINWKFFEILRQMKPFGPGNRAPVFLAKQVFFSQPEKIMKGEHVKVYLQQEGNPHKYEAIGFGLAEKFRDLDTGILFDVVFSLDDNEYQGQRTLVIRMKDIRVEEN